jgi:CAAX protease family protein
MASESDSSNQNGSPATTPPASGSDAPAASPRAPWGRADRNRLLIWAAISFIAPLPVMLALRIPLKPEGNVLTVQTELPAKAVMAFCVLLATWIVARLEKRPLADYGAPPRRALGLRFWEGFVWGFAALSAILLILRQSGHFQIDSVAVAGPALLRHACGWGLAFLAVALNEEFAFRGYFLFIFSKRLRFWRAAILLSLLFGAAHIPNPGETFLGILHVVMIGLVWCLSIRRTGTLWFAVGYHAAWDWAETFFYGTPDSGLLGVGRYLSTSVHGPTWLTGGSAGPEGSIVTVFVVLLVALLIHLRFPKVIYPDRPV